MKTLFASLILVAAFTLTASAQNTFILTNSVNSVECKTSPNQKCAGLNTLLTAWWSAGASFSPTSSGNVTTPNCDPSDPFDEADCAANGVSIVANDASGNFLGWGELLYVSNSQINFFYRATTNNDATNSTQWVYRQRNPFDGQYYNIGNANITPQTVEKRNMQPYLTYTTINGVYGGYLTGTLYGCSNNTGFQCLGYAPLKSLADGTANPREYGGWPTLMQIYVTGYNGIKLSQPGQEFPAFLCDGTFGGFGTFQVFPSGYGNGIFVANVFWGSNFSGPVWGGQGVRTVTLGYGTIVNSNQLGWIQGPADASGNRPQGKVFMAAN